MGERSIWDALTGKSRAYKPEKPATSGILRACANLGCTEEEAIRYADAEIVSLEKKIAELEAWRMRRKSLVERVTDFVLSSERTRCLEICTNVEPIHDGATMRQTIRQRIESGE